MIYTGTDQNDTIQLGPELEMVYGRAGEDVIIVTRLDNPVLSFNGEVYDGGEGRDSLYLNGFGGVYDFRLSTLRSIEEIALPTAMYASPTRLILTAEQAGFLQGTRFGGVQNVLEIHMGSSTSFAPLSPNSFSAFFIFGSRVEIFGDSSNETIQGGGGTDYIYGGAGNDVLGESIRYFAPQSGFKGDLLEGGSGNDRLIDGMGNDTLIGGSGIDEAVFDQGFGGINSVRIDLRVTTAQFTGQGQDIISGIENLKSGAGNDTLIGSILGNQLDAGPGNDLISGNGGNDTLFGSIGQDILNGGSGSDHIFGGTGRDRLIGGSGSDSLFGGSESDAFVFQDALTLGQFDTIGDFNPIEDIFWLDDRIFSGVQVGRLSERAFKVLDGKSTIDSDDRIVLDLLSGRLFFDPDGSGPADRIHFATVSSGTVLTSADFLIF